MIKGSPASKMSKLDRADEFTPTPLRVLLLNRAGRQSTVPPIKRCLFFLYFFWLVLNNVSLKPPFLKL